MLILVHIRKELLLLSRDRAGLLVLFIMPMLLVLVLSLVQDNLFRATGETASKALLVNLDQGMLGKKFAAELASTGAIELIEEIDGLPLTQEMVRQAVYDGDYQFAIIIPKGFSTEVNIAAERAAMSAVEKEDSPVKTGRVLLYFDPTVRGLYRTAVTSTLHRALLGVEFLQKSSALGRLLPVELQQLNSDWTSQPLIDLVEESAYPEKYPTIPTSVQQNVPAWTLFGMFFIVIPLAGTLIRERQEGTLTRLMSMPVTNHSLLLGKVFAYLAVCLLQCGLMLLVGFFLLPLLGTPVLELGSAPLALIVVAVSAALAACGYGILVGVLARSYEQASTFGAVSVVIAAAMGGVMVPVYVMPRLMQELSIISPLGWGLTAFLDIFVRNGRLASVMPQVAALSFFFLICITFALLIFRRWRKGL